MQDYSCLLSLFPKQQGPINIGHYDRAYQAQPCLAIPVS